MMDQKKIDLLKKLKTLAEQGVGGEKETAQISYTYAKETETADAKVRCGRRRTVRRDRRKV